ncbi:MAG: Hsp20/alpha crystallin family protein [Chloroflexi bacterium]|nr:Hsp20/alpha crystallin family protein [Chloroflexota bacterium]
MANKGIDLSNMRQSLNRVLEDTLSFAGGGSINLPIDMIDYEDRIVILTVPLLGIVPEKLDVTVTDNQLTIAGETAPGDDVPDAAYLRRERRYGRFSRRLGIPVPVDPDKARAELKHHVLKITLPKIPQEEPTVINVVSKNDQDNA